MDTPSKEELERILNKYKALRLNGVSFPKLMIALQQDLRFIPFTTALLKKGWSIERGRVNRDGEIFSCENEISYRTDIPNILEFGRANVPHASLFYGSIISEKIQNPRIVNLLESEEIFRKQLLDDANFMITVGKWEIKKDFEVAEITFSKEVRDRIPWIKKAYEYHIAQIKKEHPDDYEYLIKVLEFFSDEFAKKDIGGHEDYKLSAAYTELAMQRGLPGVIYPSIRTEYEGLNVALTPRVVEEFLELKIVGMFNVIKRGNNTLMSNAKLATNLGSLNSNFFWEDFPKLTDEQINQALIG